MYNPEITTTIKMVNISIIIFVAHLLSLSLLLPWRRFGLLSVTRDCFAFLEFCISRIISYVLFFVYLLSISVILLRFIHVVACISTSFILMDESYSIVCIYYLLFIYSSVDGHLTVSTFWLLRILLWTFMYKLLCRHVFYLLNFLFCVGV